MFPSNLSVITSESAFQQIVEEHYSHLPEKSPTASRFFVFRHGLALHNQNRTHAGRLEVPLVEQGKAQAEELGKKLSYFKMECATTSSSLRAVETLRLVLSQRQDIRGFKEEDRLLERHCGKWEGKPIDHSHTEWAPHFKIIEELPFNERFSYKFDKDDQLEETYHQAFSRAMACLQETHGQNPGKIHLISTHGGVMKTLWMVDQARHLHWVDYHRFKIDNCSFFIMDIDGVEAKIVFAEGICFLK